MMSCLAYCGYGACSSSASVPDDIDISALQTEICGNFSKETTDKLIVRMNELLHKLKQEMEGGNPDCNRASSSSVPAIDNTCVAAVSTGGKVLDVLSNCIHKEMPKKCLEFKRSARKGKTRAMNALSSATGKLVMEILKGVNNVPYIGIAASVAIIVLEHMDKTHGVDCHRVQFLDRMWSMIKIIDNVQNDDHRDKCCQIFQFVLEMSICILNKIETTSRVARFVFSHVDAADLQDMETKFAVQHQDLMYNLIISIRNDTPQVNLPPQTVTVPTTFGIKEAIEQVKTELQMGETSKKVVCTIFGLGGMGKTTLAEEVTNFLSLSNYKSCRLYIDLNSSNIAALQAQLLRDVFSTNLVVNNPSEGRTYISEAIQKNKEVKSLYIFIDNALKDKDIEDLLPIENICEAPLEIRVLITTRDSNKIPRFPRFQNKFYRIEENSAAKEILCYHADEDLTSDFAQMKEVDEVLEMCGGIPLIIKLAGRQLAKHENKAKICREMKLSALQVDNYQIADFVYEHLSDDSKKAFLDIPFFFLGWKKWKLALMYAELVIKELENAALVTTDEEGRVRMHDILRERAHRLSRGSRISQRTEWEEAIEDVEKLERIQALKLRYVDSEEDINNVNKCRKLSKLFLEPSFRNSRLHMKLCLPSSIKVLSIAGSRYSERAAVTVQPWKHLEVLRLKYVNVEGSLNNVRKDKLAFVELVAVKDDHSSVFSSGNYPCLRHLRLCGAVLEKFPSNSVDSRNLESLKLDSCERLRELESGLWQSTNLRRLNLKSCCKLENLHQRIVDLQSLQVLDLSGCTVLQRLPETFGILKSLKHLSLEGCERLESLPESFGELSSLEYLDMDRCSRLVSLCDSFCKLSRLERLDLRRCTNLSRLPETFGGLYCLKGLTMTGCKGLDCLPISFGELSSLEYLGMDGCSGLVSLCDSFCKLSRLEGLSLKDCTNLSSLPESFGGLHCLKTLALKGCKSLEFLPVSFGELSSLEYLGIDGCSGLVSLCDSFCKLSRLERLDLSLCTNLSRLPESFGSLHCLKRLKMRKCKVLDCLPISFGELSSLEYLDMDGCSGLVSLCDSFCKLSRLEALYLSNCTNLNRLPESFGGMHCLKTLAMTGCKGLDCLPISFGELSSLESLNMDGCSGLVSLCDSFCKLSRLEALYLRGCTNLSRVPESFGGLSRLEALFLNGCKMLERLPESFGHLSSLKVLIMISCEGLKCLPRSFGQLSSLLVLYMQGCIGLKGKGSLDILGSLSSLRFLTLDGCSGLEKLPDDLEGFLPRLLVMDIRSCDELIRNTVLSKFVTMQSLLMILHSTSSHTSLLRLAVLAIHVNEEVLEGQDHIIEHNVRGALKQCRSEMETLLKGKGGGRYMRMEEGGQMVWEDAVSSDVVKNGAKVLYLSPGYCRHLPEHNKTRLQKAVEEGYEVVLVDDRMCGWKRQVELEGKKLEGEVPWNEEEKQMMEGMLSQFPPGCARVWTSSYPKNCLLLALLLYAARGQWLVSTHIYDERMRWHPGYYSTSGETEFLESLCCLYNVDYSDYYWDRYHRDLLYERFG